MSSLIYFSPKPRSNTEFDELTTSESTNSDVFATLLSVTIGINTGSRVRSWFTSSFIQSGVMGGQGEFRLRIDGTVQRVTASNVSNLNEPQSCALTHRSAVLSAGDHVVDIQWRETNGPMSTVTIDPTGVDPDGHASLNVDEVAA